MSALRYLVILNLILTASGFTADILGDYLGPYDYKGYIVFDYPEGQNPINNIVFNIDPTIADNLIIVSVPSPWSHAYGAGTLTLTGGSLSPGNLVQVTVSLNKYFEDGEYPISSIGTTTAGETSQASGPLLVGDLIILNFLRLASANKYLLTASTIVLAILEYYLTSRKSKGIEALPATTISQETTEPPIDILEHALDRLNLAEQTLAEARQFLAERKAMVAQLESELEALERAAKTSVSQGGVTYHRIEEGLVTSEGLAEITDSVRESLKQARENVESAEQSVSEWEKKVSEAYESVQEVTPPPPSEGPIEGETPDDSGKTPGDTTDAGLVGVAAGASAVDTAKKTEKVCEEGKRELRPAGRSDTIRVVVDFSLFIEKKESTRDEEAAQELSLNLANLAQDIGLAGSLLGARSSGKSIVGGIGGLREGKYVTGAGGLISGTASTILSASGANIGTGQMQISIPTSLPEVVTEVLKGVANLGSIVSRKAAEWIKMNNTYGARVRYFYQTLTATPFEIWECKGNQWVCIEKVYEITISKLLRGREIGARQEFKLESDIQRTKLDRHINRLMMLVRGQLESGIKARRKFEQDHQRGPCGS